MESEQVEQPEEQAPEDNDITQELMAAPPKEEQPKQVRTAEALGFFEEPLNNTTAFVANLVLERMAKGEGVEWDKEKEGIKPAEIEALGWGKAVIRAVDYYFPWLPLDHPLIGLGMAGIGLGGIFYVKVRDIQDRAAEKEQDNQPTQEPSTDNQQPKELTPW